MLNDGSVDDLRVGFPDSHKFYAIVNKIFGLVKLIILVNILYEAGILVFLWKSLNVNIYHMVLANLIHLSLLDDHLRNSTLNVLIQEYVLILVWSAVFVKNSLITLHLTWLLYVVLFVWFVQRLLHHMCYAIKVNYLSNC